MDGNGQDRVYKCVKECIVLKSNSNENDQSTINNQLQTKTEKNCPCEFGIEEMKKNSASEVKQSVIGQRSIKFKKKLRWLRRNNH